jgi:hypothetical protein
MREKERKLNLPAAWWNEGDEEKNLLLVECKQCTRCAPSTSNLVQVVELVFWSTI